MKIKTKSEDNKEKKEDETQVRTGLRYLNEYKLDEQLVR